MIITRNLILIPFVSVPRVILKKEMDMDHMGNCQLMQGSEKQTSGSESGGDVKTGTAEDRPASSEKATLIKEETMEEPPRNESEEKPHCSQSTGHTDEAELAKEKSRLKKGIDKDTKRTRPVSASEKSDQEVSHKRQQLNPKEQRTLPNIKQEEEETIEEEQSGKASHGTANDEGMEFEVCVECFQCLFEY